MPPLHSVCVFCGSRSGTHPAYVTAARDTGVMLATNHWRLVYGAGDVGLMGEVARSAQAAKGATFGVIPVHLLGREVGKRDLSVFVITEDMHERKKVMFMNSDAIVVLPGGAGSLDEFFEVLTWAQIGLHRKPIFLLDVEGYWQPLITLIDHTIDQGFADDSLKGMFRVVPDVVALAMELATNFERQHAANATVNRQPDRATQPSIDENMNDDVAEVKLATGWKEMRVEDVLNWKNTPIVRCKECHGPVRAHKLANNGMRAHFEHLQRHEGCSRGSNFSGTKTRHPHALS